jgi:hypothetical protein
MNTGVKAGQMYTIGFGETKPVNANRTDSEKAANRRVTFDRGTPEQVVSTKATDKMETELLTAPTGTTPTTDRPAEQQMEPGSMTKPEMVIARKATRDMVFLEFKDGTFVIQFGAFKSPVNARKLADKVKQVLPDKTTVVNDAGLYKVQTVRLNSIEETVRLAKKVRMSGMTIQDN